MKFQTTALLQCLQQDISLQNIDGTDLFVVQLVATSPNGYLRQELPQWCSNNVALKPHIPKTTIDGKLA